MVLAAGKRGQSPFEAIWAHFLGQLRSEGYEPPDRPVPTADEFFRHFGRWPTVRSEIERHGLKMIDAI